MKDQRISHYRAALDALAESLSAVARVCRWEGPDCAPEQLQQTAGKLVERLGTANRLTTGQLFGRPNVVATLSRIRCSIQKLDDAYVAYRRSASGTPQERALAAAALDLEIGTAQAEACDPA